MSYNSNSSYSRTYEKKIIEETPRVRMSSPLFSAPIPQGIPDHMFSTHFPSALGGVGGGFGGSFHHSIRTTDDSIHVTMDVREFKPEELKVSVVGHHIVVEASHGEKNDDLGTIERKFTRRIPLPKGVSAEAVQSSLTAEGTLTIQALPPKPKETSSSSQPVPIKVQVNQSGH